MKIAVVWIDRHDAKIFHFSNEKMERKEIESPLSDDTHGQSAPDGEENGLLRETAKDLALSNRILLIGPGMAKHHLQTFLMEHHPEIAKKIKGLETLDHPTDAQIAALVKKYFLRVSA